MVSLVGQTGLVGLVGNPLGKPSLYAPSVAHLTYHGQL